MAHWPSQEQLPAILPQGCLGNLFVCLAHVELFCSLVKQVEQLLKRKLGL